MAMFGKSPKDVFPGRSVPIGDCAAHEPVAQHDQEVAEEAAGYGAAATGAEAPPGQARARFEAVLVRALEADAQAPEARAAQRPGVVRRDQGLGVHGRLHAADGLYPALAQPGAKALARAFVPLKFELGKPSSSTGARRGW